MRFFLLTGSLLVLANLAQAQSDVYICVNENGTKEYRNTNISRNCRRMDLPAGTNVPAPPPRKNVTQVTSTRPPVDMQRNTGTDTLRIDPNVQRSRDNDRRQILLDEMAREEKRLATLKVEYNNGEPERRSDERNAAKYQERVAAMKTDISRSEKNIETLKREIGNIK